MEFDRLTGWSLEAPRTSQLRSVYFDTTDHRLRTAGLSLRVRKEGKTFVQAVKAETKLSNGVSTPVELEAPVDGPEPQLDRITDKKLRRQIGDAIDGTALVAVFETDISRTLRRLKKKNVTLELALDDGTLHAGEHHLPIIEAELELKSGARGDMIAAAEALFADHPFEFSTSSKAERGYELARGRSEHDPQAIGSELPVFDGRASCRVALIEITQAAAKQINANRAVVMATDDPEGAHQLRVGLRRLRTALRAFSPLLDDAEKNLVAQAQSLARAVGELRDADVLSTDICAPLIADPCQSMERDDLQAALSAHRTAKRDEVRALLDSPAWRKLQLELALWPHMLAQNSLLDGAAADWAPKALDRAWKKATKRARNIETLDIPARHALRKALTPIIHESV
jgi:inorganic triphosphatase YgiF